MEKKEDTISRQAAIDALDNRFKQHLLENRFESFEEADSETKWFCDGIMESIGAVMDLPAAQPQLVRCKDCKLWPWRPLKFMDRAVEITCCGFTRGPEGFCAWGERRKNEHRENMR